ncbi:MAG: PEP/pyruvate-binding domain-containing protein [Nitrospirota bacterium]
METKTGELTTQSGVRIEVDAGRTDGGVSLTLSSRNAEGCILHWGISRGSRTSWELPPREAWPPGTEGAKGALSTAFGDGSITIRFADALGARFLAFVLYFPAKDRWDNNNGRNYLVKLPQEEGPPLEQELDAWVKDEKKVQERIFEVDEARLAAVLTRTDGRYRLRLLTDLPGGLLLHWGVAREARHEWRLPPESMRPEGTTVFDEKAARTPFQYKDRLNRLMLELPAASPPRGVSFVLMDDAGRWLKHKGKDFYIPIESPYGEEIALPPRLQGVAEEIVEAEMGKHSWTLMHRFNLCHDLMDEVRGDVHGVALLFVWLRYSVLRQLDWQRNYNTKPRELSYAQDRLTRRLAQAYASHAEARELLRMMMASVGKGGEGQRIRDEILNIMHKHHIKEVAGHFLEEWHQKLHNNTTPDDVVICEAYLGFLESDGNLDVFNKTLEQGGVTRERLKSFERPILSDPNFFAGKKEGLIQDFRNFLRTLRSVHSGTDLESAFDGARYLLGGEGQALLSSVLWTRGETTPELASKVTEARRMMKGVLEAETDPARLRDALYLDLSLENFLRMVVERDTGKARDLGRMVRYAGDVLRNLGFRDEDPELHSCLRMWEKLTGRDFDLDTSLKGKAVVERLERFLGDFIDEYYGLLQPKAEFLGREFRADRWTVSLFTEEVVRGRLLFVLSLLLHQLGRWFREKAELGNWQIISRGRGTATGELRVVDALRSVQGRAFERPAIIVARKVAGDEEPPEGVRAVISPDTTDVVSHVAVRARNARLLFATCFDPACLDTLRGYEGKVMTLRVTPAGDVAFEEAPERAEAPAEAAEAPRARLRRPAFSAYALTSDRFSDDVVGGKAMNLLRLRGKLPDWLHLPETVAVPFAVHEEVLKEEANGDVARRFEELKAGLEESPGETLKNMRDILLGLRAPEALVSSLREAMGRAGMEWPEDWERTWTCIKRVWASKWNDRAYWSRKAWGIPHEDLVMSVLIQKVVDARYAFVIHTVNPLAEGTAELYAEVIPGLGETLVGNYPGRALSFTCEKDGEKPVVLAYPSKSRALYGGGLIFRSDSNGEDLMGYAGAGIYESVMLPEPHPVVLDYTEERLLWDEAFRQELLGAIAKAGAHVEKALGGPQDIEGAYAEGRYVIVQSRPQVGVGGGS